MMNQSKTGNSSAQSRFGILALLVAVGMTSACYTNTVVSNRTSDGMVRTHDLSFFLWGVVGEEKIDLDKVCPQGFARIRDMKTFGDGVLSYLTLGIYSPRTASIK